MKYGLIGERLSHSFSREVHAHFADYEYELKEMERDSLESFFKQKEFAAINVTIPYKEAVIPFLDYISAEAKEIGAVNTVVNRGGSLYGYNTDFFGMKALVERTGADIKNKKTLILGSGGTSKTARAVAKSLGADPIITVSRERRNGVADYDEMYSMHTDAQFIINTTPVGMYPNTDESPIDLSKFNNLLCVIDAIYNPLRTKLVLSAKEMGAASEGGLYMLVAQGARASEIFSGDDITTEKINSAYEKILSEKENVVLIGMPTSGKSTVAKILADRLCRDVADSDEIIAESKKKSISEIFESEGEKAFREYEKQVIANISLQNNLIVSSGGGVILDKDNVDRLRSNGKIYFIDRPLDLLAASESRPLSRDADSLRRLYEERYEKYRSAADVIIDAHGTPEEVAEKIIGDFTR